MIDAWILLSGLCVSFSLPLLAVGVILRLCEGSWGKARGELGSTRLLVCAGALLLPLACYFAVGLVPNGSR